MKVTFRLHSGEKKDFFLSERELCRHEDERFEKLNKKIAPETIQTVIGIDRKRNGSFHHLHPRQVR